METSPQVCCRWHLDAVLAHLLAEADAAGDIDCTVSVVRPSRVLISTLPTRPDPISLYETRSTQHNRGAACQEPAAHAVGRSRSVLSSKLHAAVDGNGMPLTLVLSGGQRHDGAMLVEVLDDIGVPRICPGRPRTRPDAVGR